MTDDHARLLSLSLLAAESLVSEIRDQLVTAILAGREVGPLMDAYVQLTTQLQTDVSVGSWVLGQKSVFDRLPVEVVEGLPTLPPGQIPPLLRLLGGGEEPLIRLPLIERAAENLLSREVVTRADFDAMSSRSRRQAFTVAFQDRGDVIETIRDVLAENIREGGSLSGFREALEERIGTSRIGSGHLENVFRTNTQSAFHRGHDDLADNPIVRDVFPYQEYIAVRDDRARPEHLALEKLGLNGTNIYRRDDPMWDLFTPPWGFQCRCGVNLLTVEAAARKGVREAREWHSTGIPPQFPEFRLGGIPFRPDPSFVGGVA